MSEPLPRECFDNDWEYLRAYWEMSEMGIHPDDYPFFMSFFQAKKCPQTEEEIAHLDALPQTLVVYRGFCADEGRPDGLSWTPDRQMARWFARRLDWRTTCKPTVAIASIRKDDIGAVLLSREVEYVLPHIEDIPYRLFDLSAHLHR
tara:strand:- start:28 stop:468 length:441 start_codon:yes stop_codon:yes gene_type:complete